MAHFRKKKMEGNQSLIINFFKSVILSGVKAWRNGVEETLVSLSNIIPKD